jgi:hypothetical protein
MVWGRRQLARGPTFPRRLRGVMPIGPMTWTEFALDSPLEEAGFELSVPGERAYGFEAVRTIGFV